MPRRFSRVSCRCQEIASPSRSGSVARMRLGVGGERVGDVLDALLAVGGDLPGHRPVALGVDGAVLAHQVADVPVARENRVVRSEIAVYCLGLGWRFYDDDGHGAGPRAQVRERGFGGTSGAVPWAGDQWRRPMQSQWRVPGRSVRVDGGSGRCASRRDAGVRRGYQPATRTTRDAAAELEFGQLGREGLGGDRALRAEVAQQLILERGHRAEQAEDALGEVAGDRRCLPSRGFGCAGRRALARRAHAREHLQHVIDAAHEGRAVAQQHVAAGGAGVERVAGHGHDLAPLIERVARRDHRARPRGGLHHDHGERQAGNDAVAPRKIAGGRAVAEGPLGDGAALRGDPAAQIGVLGRIDPVEAARVHRDRAAVERRGMCYGVDAARETRDHRETRRREVAPERARHAQREAGGVAGADDGDAGSRHERRAALRPEHRGRVADPRQKFRVAGRAQRQQLGLGAAGGLDLAADVGLVGGAVAGIAGRARDAGQRVERAHRVAMLRDQAGGTWPARPCASATAAAARTFPPARAARRTAATAPLRGYRGGGGIWARA